MRRLLIVIAALVAVTIAGPQVKFTALHSARAEGAVAQGCVKWTTRPQFAAVVRREYREPAISRSELAAIAALRRCGRSPADQRWMIAYGHRAHRALARVRAMARLSILCADSPTSAVRACIRLAAMKYGMDYGSLVATATCESHLQPGSHGRFQGMWQFEWSTWRSLPRVFSRHSPYSARWSSMAAAWKMTHGGRAAWPNC